MKNLARFFIENPKLTIVFSLFLLLFGVMGLKKMNAESYPSVDFATAIIETEYYGATPEDIEVKITKPIEDELRGVTGLKDVRSISQAGRSKIVVRVDMDNPKVVVKDVMGDIQRAIDRAKDLPVDLLDKPKFTEIKSEEFAAMEIAVIGGNRDRKRDILADALKEDIEDDKNVKAVNLDGYREREFEVLLSRQKLDSFHIGVNEVLQKIGSRNTNTPGGDLETDTIQHLVRVDAKVRSAEELGEIPVRSTFSGGIIRLKDVARVKDADESARRLARYMGSPATLLTVQKKAGSDTLKLIKGVMPVLERYRQTNPEHKFQIYFDEGVNVGQKLSTLSSNALTGLIVVVAVLLIFMPGPIGLMVSISLPVILLATIGLMPFMNQTLNSITILALIIAMGMLVDNSIVIAEEYIRRRQLGSASIDAAVDTIDVMWLPISATAFTTIAAFLPMLVTTGIMGRFISPIPIIVTVALLFCLFECFLLLPMRLHIMGSRIDVSKLEMKTGGWYDRLAKKFEKFMDWTIRHRYITAASIFGVFVFSIMMMSVFNKFMLFPPEQTKIYVARVQLPEDTKVERTYEVLKVLEKKIQEALDPKWLEHSVSIAGTSLIAPNDIRGASGDNVGVVKIFATDFAKYNIKHTEFLAKIRNIKIEGATSLQFEELINGPPVGAPVTVTFRSNQAASLDGMIEKVTKDLNQVKGIFDVKVDDVYGPPEVKVILDYEKLDRLGLTAASVGNTVRTALTGTFVSDVTLNNKKAELKVSFGDVSKETVDDLANVKIMDGRMNLIPLSLIARFEQSRGTPQIKRHDFKRAKTITGNIDTEVITSVKANQIAADSFKKYSVQHPDVTLIFGGEQESTNESMASLGNAMILALIGIYAIMVYIFRSYLAPGLIMTTIPMGLLGVSVSFFFHGRPVSFLAMIGVIGLAGIIVNNGIILIDFINQMRAEGNMKLHDILVKAPTIRLKPVMATSLTTMGGLFPTAYGIGGADAMLVPMTMAMAWGLTTGTILTLVWIPSGYAIIEDMMNLWNRIPFFARIKKRAGMQNAEAMGMGK